MNYPAFMKKVDEYAERGDADELRVFMDIPSYDTDAIVMGNTTPKPCGQF